MHSLLTPLMMHDRELLQRVYRAEQAAAARCAARPRTSAPAARSPESRQRRARAAVPSASAPVRRRAYDVDQPTFYLASSTVDDDGLWHNPASSPPRDGDDVATKIAAVELQRHARGLLARRGGAARAPVAPMAAVVSRRTPR